MTLFFDAVCRFRIVSLCNKWGCRVEYEMRMNLLRCPRKGTDVSQLAQSASAQWSRGVESGFS